MCICVAALVVTAVSPVASDLSQAARAQAESVLKAAPWTKGAVVMFGLPEVTRGRGCEGPYKKDRIH